MLSRVRFGGLLCLALVLVLSASSDAAVIRVKWDSATDGPGSEWSNSYHTISAALAASAAGDEIWVGGDADHPYIENITLKDGVKLLGGFPGIGGDIGSRNSSANVTIIDGNKTGTVVTCPSALTSATVIDGFTIRNGSAEHGGGIYCYDGSPTITNNTITGNSAEYDGGGIACGSGGPVIANNTITGNSAEYGGGGIFCYESNPVITNNTITGNSATDGGGGIYCYGGSPTITNNTITGNTAYVYGGGIYCDYASSPMIANNTIIGNSAVNSGGGICCTESCPVIANNTITGNSAEYGGGGIYCFVGSSMITNNTVTSNSTPCYGGGILCYESSSPITNNTITSNSAAWDGGGGIYCLYSSSPITNNIVAFNSSGVYRRSGTGTPVLRNNCVYGNTAYNYSGISAGTGDISLDPLFVDRTGDNFHLMPGSPCIDAGLDSAVGVGWLDMDGQARIQDAHVDIGADEFLVLPTAGSISKARVSQSGAPASLSGVIVTAVWQDVFYVEQPDRACGIRVQKASHGLSVGQSAAISGNVSTSSDGEREIIADSAVGSAGESMKPLTVGCRSLGGADLVGGQAGVVGSVGLNNIGLLVNVAGRVTHVDAAGKWFTVSDGSSWGATPITDLDGWAGVRVSAGTALLPALGRWVAVTGVSSCYKSGSSLYPLVRVWRAEDIQGL